MIFRQLFEPLSSTYTYLLGDEGSGQAMLVDPVISTMERDLGVLHELGLTLAYTVDTHIHADHITAARELKRAVGSRIAAPAHDRLPCADVGIEEGVPLQLGGIVLQPLHTPGHTDGHFAYLHAGRVFTGDALLIDGCGRTDFQNGDTDAMWRSVRDKLFVLPGETQVYPGHDYRNRQVSTIEQERQSNQRLGGTRTLEQFRRIMAELKLPYPRFIEYAVPGNRQCGVCPPNLPQELDAYCRQVAESPQG
jgi:sulfur dioxygenase